MTFAAFGAPFLYTVFLWWFSTGAILWLNRRQKKTQIWGLIGASVLAAAALYGLLVSARDPTPGGAYIAFTCALAVWGWHEMSFLMGLVTGPRTAPCPPDAHGLRRFVLAAATLIYHEIALALTAIVILGITWGQPNPIGAMTFGVLFFSRLSAKLNLFLGVPNFTESFFPDQLWHCVSYLRKSPVNALFPVTLAAGIFAAGVSLVQGLGPGASPFEAVGYGLIFTLTALAILEHIFMVSPLPDEALWRWAMPATQPADTAVRPPNRFILSAPPSETTPATGFQRQEENSS
jgi:putative photosynthetic complex assembly protein 2